MTINGKMNITLPDSFSPPDQETLGKMHFYGREPELCMLDKERHMVITAGCQQLPLLSRLMLKDKEIASSMEKSSAQAMKNFDYSLIEFTDRQIGGKTASCFRYCYVAESIEMEGESCFIKDGKDLYSLYVYYRRQLREISIPVWESVLDTVSWVEQNGK